MIRRMHNLVAGRASTRPLRDIPRRRRGVCEANTAGPGWGGRGPFIASFYVWPLLGAPRQGHSLVPQGLLEYRNAISGIASLALGYRRWHRGARAAMLGRRLSLDFGQRCTIRGTIRRSTRLLGLLGRTGREPGRINWPNPAVGGACDVPPR